MKSVTIQINDLFEFDGQPLAAQRPENAIIEDMARRQFEFLRQPLQITVDRENVTVSFSEEASKVQEEAERLAARAGKRAGEGDYEKAISLLKRVLELNPLLHKARRDLAMACMESGDTEGAKNHLIEVLRLNPGDAWGWVVLGNLYARNRDDWPTAEKFLRRALEITPDDSWALNGLGALAAQRGKTDDAVLLFKRAILSNPDLPNPYHGLAVTYQRSGQLALAADALDRLFSTSRMQDVRSRGVFEQAQTLYGAVQNELVKQQHSEAFKAVENYRAELEQSSGIPVRVTEGEFKDTTTATIQMAWKHGRDHHLIKFRRSLPEELRTHQMAHELTHLALEVEARKVGRNRFFMSTSATEQLALLRLENDIARLKRKGFPADASRDLVVSLVRGTVGFLYNCPLDMLIETRLRKMPALASTQFVALHMGVQDALAANTNPKILEVTPKVILRAGLALNGAYCLFLDDLYRGACNYSAHYQRSDAFPLSQRLFQHWKSRAANLGAGDEYNLADVFADIVGLRGWYEWRPDPGEHFVTETGTKEGTSNPDLRKQKHTPAVHFLLDALRRYEKLPIETVQEIAMEIATLGRSGLDYASSDQKYTLKSLPGEKFSGLNLMCLMYAGFKRVAPEHDLHMDLDEPFLIALKMFEQGGETPEG